MRVFAGPLTALPAFASFKSRVVTGRPLRRFSGFFASPSAAAAAGAPLAFAWRLDSFCARSSGRRRSRPREAATQRRGAILFLSRNSETLLDMTNLEVLSRACELRRGHPTEAGRRKPGAGPRRRTILASPHNVQPPARNRAPREVLPR